MEYRTLTQQDIRDGLFDGFDRRQAVELCRRKVKGEWVVVRDPFIDDWTAEEVHQLVEELKQTLVHGGVVQGAFEQGSLKGFCSVEGTPMGSRVQYLDLTNLHVSREARGRGIGKKLFLSAKDWAKERGAEKLYLSAHSAVETQVFYQAMGCVEAEEYSAAHVVREPCDCQLECVL